MKPRCNSLQLFFTLCLAMYGFSAHAQKGVAQLDSPLYGVYRFSPKTLAVAIRISPPEQGNTFDSIFFALAESDTLTYEFWEDEGFVPTNCTLYDTLGPLTLLKSKKLEARVKPYFDSLYIYGTKGITRLKMKEVAFINEECYGSYILLVQPPVDTLKYGQPLFASHRKINLDYSGSFPEEKVVIENYERRANGGYLDTDSYPFGQFIPRTIFAHAGHTFFTYNDNFVWHKAKTTHFFFPLRAIYTINGRQAVQLWFDALDLYGIPCD